MPVVDFGGSSFTSNSGLMPISGAPIGLPTGRVCSDGANRAGIVALYGHVGGYYGADTCQMILGSAATGLFGVSGGGPFDTGWVGTNLWLVSGGSTTFYYTNGTRLRFYRGGGFGTTSDSSGPWPEASLPLAHYTYHQPALKPIIGTPTSNVDGTSATVPYTAPSDTGEGALTGYNVQRATNAGFTTGVQTIGRTTGQLSATFTGLTPGATYYYRVTAKNDISDAAGVLGGQWSDTRSLVQADPAGLGRQYRGGTFVNNDGKRWSGSVWQVLDGRRWSGSAWDGLGH